MNKPFLAAAVVLLTWTSASKAQDQRPSLKTETSSRSPKVTAESLMLEVSNNPALPGPGGYIDIRDTGKPPTWMWVTRWITTPGWQLPEGVLPIGVVKLEPQFNGETVEVRVTLLRGRRGFEQEELVGKYYLGVGERKVLTQLRSFGIEPFDIRIIDSVAPLPSLPVLEVRIGAVEILGVQAENRPLPAYRIKFRNLTSKNITGLKIDVVGGPSIFFQGDEGQPLIEPGSVREKYFSMVRAVRKGDAVVPGSPDVTTILVNSAVFDDGIFEGDVASACTFDSRSASKAYWLKRVLPLFEVQINDTESKTSVPAQFKEKVVALKLDASEAETKKQSAMSPACQPRGLSLEMRSKNEKLSLLRELDQIISTRPVPPVNFKSWLQSTRDRYVAWLSRLEKQGY